MTVAKQRKMKGKIKSFDKDCHKKNDVIARNAFSNFLNRLRSNSTKIIENPDKYGIDLLTLNEDGIVTRAWEIERREENWKGDVPFPFPTINCIERKEYMWRREKEFYDKIPFPVDSACEVLYVQLNDLCTRAVIIPGSVVLKYRLKPWHNRKSDNEYVRQVPIEKTFQVRLTNMATGSYT